MTWNGQRLPLKFSGMKKLFIHKDKTRVYSKIYENLYFKKTCQSLTAHNAEIQCGVIIGQIFRFFVLIFLLISGLANQITATLTTPNPQMAKI